MLPRSALKFPRCRAERFGHTAETSEMAKAVTSLTFLTLLKSYRIRASSTRTKARSSRPTALDCGRRSAEPQRASGITWSGARAGKREKRATSDGANCTHGNGNLKNIGKGFGPRERNAFRASKSRVCLTEKRYLRKTELSKRDCVGTLCGGNSMATTIVRPSASGRREDWQIGFYDQCLRPFARLLCSCGCEYLFDLDGSGAVPCAHCRNGEPGHEPKYPNGHKFRKHLHEKIRTPDVEAQANIANDNTVVVGSRPSLVIVARHTPSVFRSLKRK